MKLFKRLTALLLVLCMLPTFAVLAEDEEESAEEIVVVDGVAIDENGEEIEGFDVPEELKETVEILDAEIDDTVDPGVLELNKNLPDNVVNILLIGIDSRSAELDESNQHGDVMIVVSINKDDGTIKLTSILRDLYVTIPGYKSKNRINVAYKRGGGELAMRTVNHNFELNVEHYIVINFYGLASIIDSLGGIDIELTKQEAGAINAYIKKNPPKYDNQGDDYERIPLEKVSGVQHLDGIQAVMYARLRSIDNDFARTARQRNLLELLLKHVTKGGMDFDKLFNLLETCLPYARTNMSLNDLGSLAMLVLQSGLLERAEAGEPLLEQNRIPLDETWKYDETDSGASVVAFRTDKRRQQNIEKLHIFIYGEYVPMD